MKLTFDNYTTLIKVGLVVLVVGYAAKRGVGGVAGDIVSKAADIVFNFASEAGSAAYKGAEKVVGAATKGTTNDVAGSIKGFKDAGYNEDESMTLLLLSMGNMGA